MIDLTSTLGDLVTEDPRRARVLEGFGLDYCCGGQRSLAAASAEKGLDATGVALALDLPQPEAAPQWQALGLGGLADHIEAVHHTYMWDELDRLRGLAEKVARVHGERHPELASVRDDYVAAADDLAPHLLKEERILFPAIRALDASGASGFGDIGAPIAMMMAEHDVAGELFERMRATTGGYVVPADGCESYRQLMVGLATMEADLHEHIHKENNVLFPRTLQAQDAAR